MKSPNKRPKTKDGLASGRSGSKVCKVRYVRYGFGMNMILIARS